MRFQIHSKAALWPYNAQISVDTESMLIMGNHLTQNTKDKKELLPAIACIDKA